MKVYFLLAILVAIIYVCESKKHHKNHEKKDLFRKPSAKPFHHGSKHRTGHLRGQHLFGKHSGSGDVKSVHDYDWMKFPVSKDCKKECKSGEFCIKYKHTGEEKCVNRRKFKEGRKLFRDFHRRKNLLKDDVKGVDQKLMDMKKNLRTAENMREVYDLMKHYKKEPVSKPKMLKHDIQVKKPAEVIQDSLFKEATATDECRPREMYELRKRLTGYFVLLHTESRQRHHRTNRRLTHPDILKKHGSFDHIDKHQKHKGGHKKSKRSIHDVAIETESHGHCKCSKSVMWEFRKQDADRDGYLSHEELGTLEGNMREPCMKPLFKSCDRNNDKKLAHVEWCCCLADTVAPCAEKARLTDSDDWKPRCDKEGYYEREQCHDKSGYCWCVDLNGRQIHGTKKYGSAHCGKYDPNGKLIKP